MRIDMSEVQDERNYASIPEGVYQLRVGAVRPALARDGSPRWSLKLEVAEGEYAGRVACFDALTWSERGTVRVKLVLAALGFDVSGMVEVEPEDLVGKVAPAQVITERWVDPQGEMEVRNTIPFRGWGAQETVAAGEPPFEAGPRETPF